MPVFPPAVRSRSNSRQRAWCGGPSNVEIWHLTRVALGRRCGSALLASAIEVRLPRMLDGPFGQSPAGFVPSMLRIGRTSPAEAVLRATGTTPA
jgi:hypothetical protein